MRCDECRFYEKYDPALDGLCHRFPRLVRRADSDWCGEFSRGRTADAARAAKDEQEFYDAFRGDR